MAIQTPVNQDISKIKNNFLIGLSFREVLYSAIGLLLGTAFILFTFNYIGINLASVFAIIIVMPIAACGFVNVNELFLFDICKSILFQSSKLVFKTDMVTKLSKKEIKANKKQQEREEKSRRKQKNNEAS